MATFKIALTSPNTGQTYHLQSDTRPTEDDLHAAGAELDKRWWDAQGTPEETRQQGPVGTFGSSMAQILATPGTGLIQGTAGLVDKASKASSIFNAPARLLATALTPALNQAAGVASDLEDTANQTYPTNPANPKAQVVGSGLAQGMTLLAGGAVGKAAGLGNAALTTLPLASGALSGAHEGMQKAQEIGVESPEGQAAMGLLFGGIEAGTEKLFGLGNKAATEAMLAPWKKTAGQMLKDAAKSIGGEASEEVIAGSAQDLLTRAFAMEDPNRPGYTTTGVELPKMDRKMLERRGLEALGGAAGGTIFAGVEALNNRNAPPPLPAASQQETTDDNVPPNETTGAAAPPPMGVVAGGQAVMNAEPGVAGLEEHTGDLTAEEVADLEGGGQNEQNLFANKPRFPTGGVLDKALNVATGQQRGEMSAAVRGFLTPEAAAPSAAPLGQGAGRGAGAIFQPQAPESGELGDVESMSPKQLAWVLKNADGPEKQALLGVSQQHYSDPATADLWRNYVAQKVQHDADALREVQAMHAEMVPPGHGEQYSMADAHAAAAQGSGTQWLPLWRVFQEAQKTAPGLQPQDFLNQVRKAYDNGQVMLEGANSQDEVKAAQGWALHNVGNGVGVGIRMAVPQGQPNLFANQGRGEVNESRLSDELQPGNLPGDVTQPADFTAAEAADRVRRLEGSLHSRGELPRGQKLLPAAAGTLHQPVQRALEFGKAVAGLFGRRVVAIEGLTENDWGGVTSPAVPDTVFWNPKRKRAVDNLVGHELLHHLEVAHPAVYQRMDDLLSPEIRDMAAARQQYTGYKGDDNVRREVYADLLGESLKEPEFWDRMAKREPEIFLPLARAVWQWFGQVINALKGRGWSASPYFKDLQKAQDVLAQAMVEFARREHGMSPQQAQDAVRVTLTQRDNFMQGREGGANETQARYASPDAAARVIDGPRTDEMVKEEAKAWLGNLTPEQAVAAFEQRQGLPSLDAQQHAAGLLITNLSKQASEGKTEMARMWHHALAQKMARIWTKEYLSADPARALRQRALVNATILGPMAPVLAAQEVLVDRATKVMDRRFDGGAEGAADKLKKVVKTAEKEAGDTLAAQLGAERLLQDVSDTWQRILQQMQQARENGGAAVRAVKSKLSVLRDAARARLKQTANRFANAAEQEFSDEAIIGAAVLADGVVEYDAWKRTMQRELGEQTAERMLGIYAEASRLFHQALVIENARARGAEPSEEELSPESDDRVRERAEARASRIIYKAEERLRQGSKDLTSAAGGDSINKAFREQVTSPMPLEAFQARLEKLNVGADVAARLHQTATREATDQQAMRDYRADAAREQRAVQQASRIIYKTEERLRQGSKDLATGATGDSINKAFRDQLKNPLSYDAFRKRLQALGVPPEVSGPLYRTALRETEDRAKMAQFKEEQAARDLARNQPALAKMLNDLRGKLYGGMKWQEIFTDLPDAQKQRQRALYQRLLKDERLQGLNQQERLALTNELDKAWQRERRKVFQREMKKAGVMGEKKDSDRQKVVNAMPRLLRMVNLGLFNSEMFREAVAPEYGLRILDAKAASGLRKLAEEAYAQPEGILRNRKLGELLHGLQKETGSSLSELVNSYWTASVLSGLRTQFDTFLAFVNGMGTNLMQAGMLIARSGNGPSAAAAHAQWWRALKEGVRESAQILYRGDYSYLKRFGEDLQKALEGESAFRPMPLGESLWRNGNVWQKWGMAPVMMWTGRLMAAADHINNTATTAGAQAVARALHPELYQGRVSWTAEEQGAARAQAWREVTGGTEPVTEQDKTTVQVRMRELLAGGLQESDRLAASNIGDMAAYQNDPTGVFGGAYGMLKAGLSWGQRKMEEVSSDVERTIEMRTLMAFAAGSVHGLTGTRFMRFGFNFGADITRYMPGTYVLGRRGFYGKNVSQMEQDLLLGKNLVGLMLLGTLAAMFLRGGDDEEKGWQIEGDWSNLTPQQQKERLAAGLERMTMWKREGGQVRRVSYKQWPTMGLFAAVGAMKDEQRHKPEKWASRGAVGHYKRAMMSGLFQIQNVSAMRGLADLFATPTFSADPASEWFERLTKQGMQYVGGFLPTFVKDVDAWNDPRSFKAEEDWETFARTVPIWRTFVNDGRPQINLLGEEVQLQRSPWSRAYTSVESAEAHRVLGALLSRGLTLPQPSDDVKVYDQGKKVPLSSLGREKVWKYEKAVGEGYKAWLSTDGAALLQMPVDRADKVIDRRADVIRKQALAKVMR